MRPVGTAAISPGLAAHATALARLRRSFTGPLIAAGTRSYDQHRRVWNGAIDRHPALIARCRSTDDALAALQFARASGLELAIRGGGHSFPGHSTCDGGIMIDLGLMKRIAIDPKRRRATVQPGVLLGELDRATQRHGLIVPSGIVTHTGVAGLTLGGGIGWLQRKYGLTIDQLRAVRLITADGQQLTADEQTNPELFWGIRGAGANFGLVTEFDFQLQPLDQTVLAGPIIWDMRHSPQLMRHYRDWIESVPDELTTILFHRRAPRQLGVDQRPIVMIGCCYAGPVDDGERAIAPLRRFAKPLLDLCQPKSFLAHQAMLDPTFTPGLHYYFRAHDTGPLTNGLIDTLAEHARTIRSAHSGFGIFHNGGAISRTGENDTAFNGRRARHTINLNAIAETAAELDKERHWAQRLSAELTRHETGVYVNFLMDEPRERLEAAFGPAKYTRLRELKRAYDPDNLFHRNHNIPPG